MTTSEPASNGGETEPLTLFAADSPASPSASRGRGSRRRIAGGSGQRSRMSFARYDPATRSWKTFQDCLDGASVTFSETWPSSGMTRNGIAYRLPTSVPPIYATGSGLWHTSQAADAWVPTTISENTLRRGDPNGSLRTAVGSLAKQAANPSLLADAMHSEQEVTPGYDAVSGQRAPQRWWSEQPARTGPGSRAIDGHSAARDVAHAESQRRRAPWADGQQTGSDRCLWRCRSTATNRTLAS